MALTPEQIQSLLASRRVKGLYEEKMNFIICDTDEPGFDVKEDWPIEFGSKSATTMYQGFNNAAKKLQVEDQVDIIQRDGTVFILVKSRVGLAVVGTNGDSADHATVATEVA